MHGCACGVVPKLMAALAQHGVYVTLVLFEGLLLTCTVVIKGG